MPDAMTENFCTIFFGKCSMKNMLILLTMFAVLMIQPAIAGEACPPGGYSKPGLLELRQSGFRIDDEESRNALAVAMLACVGHPDPEIRDGVVFEGLAGWLRGKLLATETIDTLYRGLLAQLEREQDEAGFQRPFAVLILSEVARTDRIEERFTPSRRAELVAAASGYLAGVRDYRGFSDTEGWRHGVAHGSDLILQLVLNEKITEEQLDRLMSAVSSQVSPPGENFYTYGEPARLARPVFYLYQRGVFEDGYWKAWFESVSDPAPMESWNDAYSSNAGLARRHNTLAFLVAVHLQAGTLKNEQGRVLTELLVQALKRIL
jgi:hypothetical protein